MLHPVTTEPVEYTPLIALSQTHDDHLSVLGTQGISAAAAALAQAVDWTAQDHGLSSDSRRQLYLFAIQTNSSTNSLWLYALMLQHNGVIGTLRETVESLSTRIDDVTLMIRREWKMTEAQQRLIAADIIAATTPPNAESTASGSNTHKRPRNDTGFWAAVDAKFKELVEAHGETTTARGGKHRFANAANQFPPKVVHEWANSGSGADAED
ncbi:hypothetical protein FRC11_000686 [Ceratobasidium sp. 423]|nr:hypothetical protein FRC11_000686 [Ceratobasidium sp. 423]